MKKPVLIIILPSDFRMQGHFTSGKTARDPPSAQGISIAAKAEDFSVIDSYFQRAHPQRRDETGFCPFWSGIRPYRHVSSRPDAPFQRQYGSGF